MQDFRCVCWRFSDSFWRWRTEGEMVQLQTPTWMKMSDRTGQTAAFFHFSWLVLEPWRFIWGVTLFSRWVLVCDHSIKSSHSAQADSWFQPMVWNKNRIFLMKKYLTDTCNHGNCAQYPSAVTLKFIPFHSEQMNEKFVWKQTEVECLEGRDTAGPLTFHRAPSHPLNASFQFAVVRGSHWFVALS